MKVGDLVKYNDKYTTDLLVGIVLQVDSDDAFYTGAPYRVRWFDHLASQRDWYEPGELVLL